MFMSPWLVFSGCYFWMFYDQIIDQLLDVLRSKFDVGVLEGLTNAIR